MMALCSTACGVELAQTQAEIEALPNGSELLSIYPENDIETYRDVLYFTAQVLGGFFCINREGKLEFRQYGETPVMEIQQKHRFSSSFSDFVTRYTAVSSTNLRTQTSEYYALDEDNGLTMNLGANPLLQFGLEETRAELCRNILTALSTVNYVPFDSDTIGNPALDIYELSDNLPVAYASNDVNSTANTARGSLNLTESMPIANGYKFVWEFTPSQGNGTIAAVALTSSFGGENAYGSLVGDASTFLQLKAADIGSIPDANKMVLFEAVEMDFENSLLYSITYENDSVRIRKLRIPVFSIGLNERLDDSTYTVLEDEVLTPETFEFLGSYTKHSYQAKRALDGHDHSRDAFQ